MSRDIVARELLVRIAGDHSPAALASSLSAEDMVLTDLIAREHLPVEVFVLDTGRLHGDTLDLIGRIEQRYRIVPRVHQPDPAAVDSYIREHGLDAFYGSLELRQRCCEIRKVEPLGRALADKRAWITGLRRGQSAGRSDIPLQEFDLAHGIPKFNPLAEWSEDEVWAYVKANDVPYNPLYDQGYRSIGCAPCTRPVAAGEDPRAGRWWWESAAKSECGIHVVPAGVRHTRIAA
jgi:phosphoadenosine phosphosulfate reductase